MSFAALSRLEEHRGLTSSPQLDDWVRQPDFAARLTNLGESSLPGLASPTHISSPTYTRTIKSSQSSMAGGAILHHQPTASAPSLRYSFTTTEATPTETSISTGLAGQFPGVPLLEENAHGILEVPRAALTLPVYECAFWFLSCPYVSTDQAEWETHCLSHFRGEEPPSTSQCPLCDWTYTHDDGRTSWHWRMQHLAFEHTMLGHTLRTSRPDFNLFRFLWNRRLIDDEDLKELNGGNHNLTNVPGSFVETGGRRRERGGRRHRVQHASSPR
jgi:hypothetical protein